ncbi:hypothetical protein MHK_003012, partial [Candidatus Magnetomorum sp. HK-1]
MKKKFAIKTLVPDEIYTDRKEFIDYFYNAALKAATRRTMSTVLLGQRRMGKTEIFKRVVNRLFFEQDHTDPNAVVPVYYKFPDRITDPWKFAIEYVDNFVRWYAAFRMKKLELLSNKSLDTNNLPDYIRQNIIVSEGFAQSLFLLESFKRKGVIYPEKEAVNIPRLVSDLDDSTI